MTLTTANNQSLFRVALIDVVLLATAVAVPAMSHLLAFPLYQLNPMLLVLLAGMLLVSDRRNALLLAVLLPAVSCLATGMPTPMKALCMGAELTTVVLTFSFLSRFAEEGWLKICGAMLVATLLGKVVFYGLKALLIAPVVLVNTSISLQLLVVVLYAVLFTALKKNRK